MNNALIEAMTTMIRSAGSAERLMQEHRSDRGRCSCCKAGPQAGGVIWPCTTYAAASLALVVPTQRIS